VSNYLEDVRGEDFDVVEPFWKDVILEGFMINEHVFHQRIWDMSMTAFDKPREVQVLIDANDNTYISVGSPGFVSFDGQDEQLYGKDKPKMKFPLKEWIHTHPFGQAYFSGTDQTTIRMYERFLDSATVIGNGEKLTIYFRADEDRVQHYQEFSQFIWVGEQKECCSNCKGEEE